MYGERLTGWRDTDRIPRVRRARPRARLSMPMYTLIINVSFSAAHFLRDYNGPCETMHGHNFRVEARVSGTELNGIGIVMDFKVIKKLLREVTDRLDHQVLDQIPPFDKLNPTAENIARHIFDEVAPPCAAAGAKLSSVGVWETEGCGVIYTPGE